MIRRTSAAITPVKALKILQIVLPQAAETGMGAARRERGGV